MSFTRSVPPESAGAPTAATFDRIRSRAASGAVSRIWQSLALDPPALEAVHALYRTLMDDPAPLTRAEAELIAVVVSATNGCGYCVAHHGPKLAKALGDEPLARAVALDYRQANLPARHRVLLDYVVALSCEPAERTAADVERMREYGYGDEAIVRATAIGAYYALSNRIASGLGVALEPALAAWPFGEQR